MFRHSRAAQTFSVNLLQYLITWKHNLLRSSRHIVEIIEYLHRVLVGVAKELPHDSTLKPAH